MLERKTFRNREEWLAGRTAGIGASEAAATVGLSPFESAYELWERKTGQKPDKDLTGNPVIEYGNRLEPIVRSMFQAEHPELKVDYHQFDILYQTERPWITATLDGELTDENGRKGVLEIKTNSVGKKAQWDAWKDAIPVHYLCQVCQQLYVTGWDYAYLYAKLKKLNGDSELREYRIERSEHEEDIRWLVSEIDKFWEPVKSGTPPPIMLPNL